MDLNERQKLRGEVMIRMMKVRRLKRGIGLFTVIGFSISLVACGVSSDPPPHIPVKVEVIEQVESKPDKAEVATKEVLTDEVLVDEVVEIPGPSSERELVYVDAVSSSEDSFASDLEVGGEPHSDKVSEAIKIMGGDTYEVKPAQPANPSLLEGANEIDIEFSQSGYLPQE